MFSWLSLFIWLNRGVETPKVSIVIINWKTPDLLAGCLRSIIEHTKNISYETFVVDNNSADGSVEMIRWHFPETKLTANDTNVGFAAACNQVIPSARGEYILLLNPDTLLVDNSISTLALYMDNNPQCGAAGPKVLNPDGTLQLACRRAFPTPKASFYRLTYLSKLFPRHPEFARYNLTYADPDQEMPVDALSGSCMMVRNSAVKRIGLLDEDIFMFGEDIDWCWRLKQDGWTVNYVPAARIYHYHGASSRFRRVGATINLHKGMEVFYRKHFAGSRSPLINLFIYAAIWLRAGIFIMLSCLQNMFPQNTKKLPVFSPNNEQSEESSSSGVSYPVGVSYPPDTAYPSGMSSSSSRRDEATKSR